jgi:hypothetical protein
MEYDRKQAKMQDPIQSNVGNFNNIKCEVSTHFRNKKMKNLKAKIDKLEIDSKSKISETCIEALMTL